MRYVGIDPGKDGAIALAYDVAGGSVVQIASTPLVPTGKGSKRDYDLQGMRTVLLNCLGPVSNGMQIHVTIESPLAMPGQNVVATMSQGVGYGLWLGLLAGLQIPYSTVYPLSWKKALVAPPRTKQASVAAALRFYPKVRDELVGPKGGLKDGKAEALLLAHFGKYHGPSRQS